MNPETKICQNCKQNFTIEPEDFAFYKRISVPPPAFCPECRMIRRLTWLDERALYHGICNLCKKEIFSLYPTDSPFVIYCQECWFSDAWDSMDYGRPYDFSKSFFEQFGELIKAVPRPATVNTNSVNCRYCNDAINSKNCYYSFVTYETEDCLYATAPLMTKQSVDVLTTTNGDHLYECIWASNAYHLSFCYDVDNCIDCSFLFDCRGCTNCFGGVNLRNRKYVLFNEQLSKDEYFEKMEYWDIGSHRRLEEAKEKFEKLLIATPHRHALIVNSINVSGDHITNSKNCLNCFNIRNASRIRQIASDVSGFAPKSFAY